MVRKKIKRAQGVYDIIFFAPSPNESKNIYFKMEENNDKLFCLWMFTLSTSLAILIPSSVLLGINSGESLEPIIIVLFSIMIIIAIGLFLLSFAIIFCYAVEYFKMLKDSSKIVNSLFTTAIFILLLIFVILIGLSDGNPYINEGQPNVLFICSFIPISLLIPIMFIYIYNKMWNVGTIIIVENPFEKRPYTLVSANDEIGIGPGQIEQV